MTTSRLRVMYVVPDLAVGGAERHAVTLLPRLDPERFAPRAVCIGRPGALFDDLVAAGVPAVALHRGKRQPFAAVRALVQEMRRHRPDVVIVRGYLAEGLGRVAAVLAGVSRVVVWVHNHGSVTPRGRVRRMLDRVLDRATDAYYGVAHAQREYITAELGHPASKIRIIHNGVDPDRFVPQAPRDPAAAAELGIAPHHRVAGILAVMRPEKDHALLLRAARRVVDELPEARFLLVGDGPERARLEKLTADLGLVEHVVFAGTRADVPAMLSLMDVVTLASHSVECFPMALLEAMAAGRPAVSTAVGGVPELVDAGRTGHLVPPHDEAALAAALLDLLRNPGQARTFGAAARERVVAEFTLDRSVRAAEAALAETAGTRRPAVVTLVLDRTHVGGAEMVLLNTFRHLDPRLVRPRVVCLRSAGPLAADFRAAGIDVEVIARGRLDTRLPRLVADLRRSRTDVVLVTHHQRAALAIGRLAAPLAGARSAVAVHDMDLTAVGKRCLPRSAVETLALSSALLLLSPSQGEYLRREEGVARFPWRRTREVVVRNGVDLDVPTLPRDAARSRLGLGPDEVVVGIVARLSAQKAHHVLVHAVASLAPRKVRLVVVGDGERAAELRALAAELGVDALFTGTRRDVRSLLPAFDMLCLSSVHEGVPITVIEAMAAGLPVVATDCGALRDLVTEAESGYLVPVGDVDALASRIAALADDPHLRARLGAAGRARARRELGITHTAAAFTDLMTSLTGVLR